MEEFIPPRALTPKLADGLGLRVEELIHRNWSLNVCTTHAVCSKFQGSDINVRTSEFFRTSRPKGNAPGENHWGQALKIHSKEMFTKDKLTGKIHSAHHKGQKL